MNEKDKERLLRILGYKRDIEKKASEKRDLFSTRMSKIKDGGNNQKMIEVSYIDSKGKKTKRLVEPYKLIETDFWGYDPMKDSIRRFKTKNIKGVKNTGKKYEPRWDIEMLYDK